MPGETDYAYAIGRIRVIEKGLLDVEKFNRMVNSGTPAEALKILLEIGYGGASTEATVDVFQYEDILKREREKLYQLLRELSGESTIFDVFLLKNDYHNIKVILKSEFIGEIERNNNSNMESNIKNLMVSGTLPVMQIKASIKERTLEEFYGTMKEGIKEAIDTFNRTRDPRQIDLILDKACFLHMNQLANSFGSPFLKDIVEIFIDLANINTFLRIKNLNISNLDISLELLEKSLLLGGNVKADIFINNMESALEDFLKSMESSPYYNICKEGISDFINGKGLTKFERLADDYVINFVKRSKYKILGIEPLIGYLIAKENELKNVRIIMVGKINNINPEMIRKRMRESYV